VILILQAQLWKYIKVHSKQSASARTHKKAKLAFSARKCFSHTSLFHKESGKEAFNLIHPDEGYTRMCGVQLQKLHHVRIYKSGIFSLKITANLYDTLTCDFLLKTNFYSLELLIHTEKVFKNTEIVKFDFFVLKIK